MHSYLKKHKNNFNFKKFVKQAFAEDVGNGDHTTLATLKKNKLGIMQLLVKQEGILAGVEAVRMIFKYVNPKIKFQLKMVKKPLEAENFSSEKRKNYRWLFNLKVHFQKIEELR